MPFQYICLLPSYRYFLLIMNKGDIKVAPFLVNLIKLFYSPWNHQKTICVQWGQSLRDNHLLCSRLFKGLLANEQKEHIKSFAAESFAFLIRKSKNHQEVINMLLSELNLSNELSEGVGLLIFHSIKGVKEQFRSNGGNILSYCLNGLLHVDSNSEQVSNKLFLLVL